MNLIALKITQPHPRSLAARNGLNLLYGFSVMMRIFVCLLLCLPIAAQAQGDEGEVISAGAEEALIVYPKATLVQGFSTTGFPSPDPAGLTYLPGVNRLLISDSEVEEASYVSLPRLNPVRNLFQTTLTGTLVYSTTTLAWGVNASGEPAGARYNAAANELYIADDDKKRIYIVTPGVDGQFGTSDDGVTFFVTISPPYNITDPEDVAFAMLDGKKALIIIDGTLNNVAVVKSTDDLFGNGNDLVFMFSTVPFDTLEIEGVAFDSTTQAIILSGKPRRNLLEVSTAGVLRRYIDINVATPIKPSGLELLPSSTVSGTSLYIADRGLDTQVTSPANANDGRVYELSLPPITAGNQPPLLDAGLNQVVTVNPAVGVTTTVILSAIVTDTLVPDRIRAQWEKVKGPGSVVYKNDNLLQTTATFTNTGAHVLKLTVNDGELYAFDYMTVTLNVAPTVNAGPDLTLPISGTANLNGIASDDGLPIPPGVISSTWSLLSGPGIATFANAQAQATTASFDLPGVYIVKLTASDGAATVQDTAMVTVTSSGNLAPIVNAGADVSVSSDGTANLVGTVRDDGQPVPGTLTYLWSKVSGPGDITFGTPTDKDTTATFSASGIYTVQLAVSDGELTTNDTLIVNVAQPNNTPPTVDAGLNQTVPLTGTVALNGLTTDDGIPNATLVVTWTQVSGPGNVLFANANLAQTSASFTAPGVYVLQLTVYDGDVVADDTVTITINQAPTVSAGIDQSIAQTGTVTLNGAVTDDGHPNPPGSVTIAWSKVSGPGTVTFANASKAKTTATFSTAGSYVLQLLANDSQLSGVDIVTINVAEENPGGTNKAPVVNAGADQTVTVSTTVTLNGTVTDDGLPTNNLVVSWTKVSGPGTVSFADPNAIDTTVTFSAPGTYILRLSAADDVLITNDEITIVVQPKGTSTPMIYLPFVSKK